VLARLVEVLQRRDGALYLGLGDPAVFARRNAVLAALQTEGDPVGIGAGVFCQLLQECRARGISGAFQVGLGNLRDGDLVNRFDGKRACRRRQDLADLHARLLPAAERQRHALGGDLVEDVFLEQHGAKPSPPSSLRRRAVVNAESRKDLKPS